MSNVQVLVSATPVSTVFTGDMISDPMGTIVIKTNTYAPNSQERFTANFYNTSGGLADPTTAILWVSGPDGTTNQYTPTRDAIGQYHYDYTTATPGGKWYYRYQGVGSINVQSLDVPFYVSFPQF